MTEPDPKPISVDPAADVQARRERLRRKLAAEGVTLHLPPPGVQWSLPEPLPISADELSEMVIRVRRGDL